MKEKKSPKKITKKVVAKPVVKAKPVTPAKKSGLTLKFFDLEGKPGKDIELPAEIFNTVSHPKLLAQYVRVFLANNRSGNASTKTRAQVRGSTRKIYRQKGTGRARHGSRRAPIFVGGGIIGGPTTKDFSLKLNKKQRRKALFSALTIKYKEENTIGLATDTKTAEPKTKIVSKFLKLANLDSKKVLLVLSKFEKNNLVLAARNIPSVTVVESQSINPYLILQNDKVIFAQDALESLKKHFLKAE